MEHNVIYSGNTRYKLYSGSNRMGVAKESVAPLPYDAEIEYLESTGTQWISTGYYSNNTETIEFTVVTDGNNGYMGSNGNQQMNLSIMSYLGKRTIYVIHAPNDVPKTYVNGVIRDSRAYHTFNGFVIALFAMGTSATSVSYYASCKLYSANLVVNGVTIADFTPVRVGQVGYMYDRVSGQLFGNTGTGDFILGNDIN